MKYGGNRRCKKSKSLQKVWQKVWVVAAKWRFQEAILTWKTIRNLPEEFEPPPKSMWEKKMSPISISRWAQKILPTTHRSFRHHSIGWARATTLKELPLTFIRLRLISMK